MRQTGYCELHGINCSPSSVSILRLIVFFVSSPSPPGIEELHVKLIAHESNIQIVCRKKHATLFNTWSDRIQVAVTESWKESLSKEHLKKSADNILVM